MITIKHIIKLIRKVIFSFMLLFSLNVMIKSVGIILPINVLNVLVITFLGIPGLIVLLIIKMFII